MLGVKEIRKMMKRDAFDEIKDLFREDLTKKAYEEAIMYLNKNIDKCKKYLCVDTDSREFRLLVKKTYVNYSFLPTLEVTEYKTILEDVLRAFVIKEAKKYIKGLKTRKTQLRKALELFYKLIKKDEYISDLWLKDKCKRYGIKSIPTAKKAAAEYKKTDIYKMERREAISKKLYYKTLEKYNVTSFLSVGYAYLFTKKWLHDLKEQVEKNKALLEKYGFIPHYIKSKKEVLKSHSGYCEFLDVLAKVDYSEDENWEYYSKAWHRAHGPKRTITDRRVTFYKKELQKTIHIDKFAGDFILKAYIEAFKVKKYRQKGFARKVQLQDHFRAKKLKKIGNIEIWERTVNKQHYDYCAVLEKTTYHAESVKEAIRGVQNKIQAKIDFDKVELCWEDAKKLGFCDAGIKAFCEVNSLDCDKCYTREFLKGIVANNRENNKQFKDELQKIKIW